MTLGTVLFLAIIGYYLIKYKKYKNLYIHLLSFYIFCSINIEVGYFLKINNSMIKYSWFTEIVLLLSSLIVIWNIKIAGIKIFFPTMLATLFGVINLYVNPLKQLMVTGGMLIDRYWDGWERLRYPRFDGSVLTCLVHYFSFLIILIAMVNYLRKEDFLQVLNCVCKLNKIVIIYALVEFVFKNIFKSNILIGILQYIFGVNNSVFVHMEKVGGLYRLSCFCTEPAHFAYALFIICICFFVNYYIGKEKLIWAILAIILQMLSMSFSAILFVGALFGIMIIVYQKNNIKFSRKFINAFLIGVLSFVVVLLIYNSSFFQNSYYGQRIAEIVNDELLFTRIENVRKYTWSSSRIRLVSLTTTLQLVKYRPMFGIGIGTTSSHSSMAAIISGLGILGTFFWLKALFFNICSRHFVLNKDVYILLIFIWLFVGLFVGSFWGFLYNGGNLIILLSFLFVCEEDRSDKNFVI